MAKISIRLRNVDFDINNNIDNVIEDLNRIKNENPQYETINIGCYGDDGYVVVQFTGVREETQEEALKRMEQAADYQESTNKWEISELERLSKKHNKKVVDI